MEVVCILAVELAAGVPIISCRQILECPIQGSTYFLNISMPPPNSKGQKVVVKQVPY